MPEPDTHVVLCTASFFGRGFNSRRLHQFSTSVRSDVATSFRREAAYFVLELANAELPYGTSAVEFRIRFVGTPSWRTILAALNPMLSNFCRRCSPGCDRCSAHLLSIRSVVVDNFDIVLARRPVRPLETDAPLVMKRRPGIQNGILYPVR